MIGVRLDGIDASTAALRDASLKALKELKETYQPGMRISIQDELYKSAMPFLLTRFNGKCAYCESIITTTHPGDVEHYRPKGRIKDGKGRVVKIRVNGEEVDHPGYWWLCYDWSNLLPSCIDCNRKRKHGEDLLAAGKGESFPIAGKYAETPSDRLELEQPLLLNPTAPDFDATQHFVFRRDGRMIPQTSQAKATCETLGLNLREKLVEQRANVYLAAMAEVNLFVTLTLASVLTDGRPSEQERATCQRLNEIWEGRTAYSAFARLALQALKEGLGRKGIQIAFPLRLA